MQLSRISLGITLLGMMKAGAAMALDFTAGALDSRVTFARASTAWYVNSAGVLTQAASGAPRFDYDPVTLAPLGLLIEEARTNLLLNSDTLSTQSVTVTAQAYSLSFYGTGSITLSGAYSGTLAGSGAYPARSKLTFTPTAGTLTVTVSGSVRFAQLEAGVFASSYIQTAGSSATRALETATMTGTNFSSWWNSSEGTFTAEYDVETTTTLLTLTLLSADDGTTTNRISLFTPNQTNGVNLKVSSDGDMSAFGQTTGINRVAAAFKANDCAVAVNGSAAVTDATVTIPTVNQLVIGGRGGTVNPLNGHIRKLAFYSRRVANSEVVALSA